VLGEKHPLVAKSLNELAILFYTQGKYADAELFFQCALAIQEQKLEHSDIAASLDNLEKLYDKQGKYADAELLYQRVLAIQEKQLGQSTPTSDR
jgi:tetratricopeptide (TPR) repeat protein